MSASEPVLYMVARLISGGRQEFLADRKGFWTADVVHALVFGRAREAVAVSELVCGMVLEWRPVATAAGGCACGAPHCVVCGLPADSHCDGCHVPVCEEHLDHPRCQVRMGRAFDRATTVQRNGVRHLGHWYWHQDLVLCHLGEKVCLEHDPERDEVAVFDLQGQRLGTARRRLLGGISATATTDTDKPADPTAANNDDREV